MTLELHARPDEVMRAVEALQGFGRERGIGERDLFDLALALEECGSNIVNHALQRDAQKTFHVDLERTHEGMVIVLRDPGPAFDPTSAPGRVPLPDEDSAPGGWGIYLVRRCVDEICYSRDLGINMLRLTKRVQPARETP